MSEEKQNNQQIEPQESNTALKLREKMNILAIIVYILVEVVKRQMVLQLDYILCCINDRWKRRRNTLRTHIFPGSRGGVVQLCTSQEEETFLRELPSLSLYTLLNITCNNMPRAILFFCFARFIFFSYREFNFYVQVQKNILLFKMQVVTVVQHLGRFNGPIPMSRFISYISYSIELKRLIIQSL